MKIGPHSTWRDLPLGGKILEPGNAEEYSTSGWRNERPVWDFDKCTHCLICWIICPDSAVIVNDHKIVRVNLEHCKGCGICAVECPPKIQAIEMVGEAEFAEEAVQKEVAG